MKKVMVLLAMAVFMAGFALADDYAACGGNQCPEAPDTFQQISIGAMSNFGGYGGGVFTGDTGGVNIEKSGYGLTEMTLTASGDGCGLECGDAEFTFNGAAGEMIQVGSWAAGEMSDTPVSVINEGGTFSGLSLQFAPLQQR